jgi:hypothetical protein
LAFARLDFYEFLLYLRGMQQQVMGANWLFGVCSARFYATAGEEGIMAKQQHEGTMGGR